MSKRPQRERIDNELGRPATLAEGPSQFTRTGSGKVHLFLGLGPKPGKLSEYFPGIRQALYLECPDFESQMDAAWKKSIPSGFTRIDPDELTEQQIRKATIYRYLQGPRLFPSFWGPVWARCGLTHLAKAPWPEKPVVWLPGGETGLLSKELALAFGGLDWAVRWIPPNSQEESLPWQLAKQRPRLFLSINFRGIDSYGRVFYYLREAGARVAVWFVDNPFHVLTGAKAHFWKEMDLFVTDKSFVEPLKNLGATSVHHLPLATSPALFGKPRGDLPEPARGVEDRLVFVGRSAFPGKQEFFAGVGLDDKTWDAARDMLSRGERPDFFWWAGRLGLEQFWPGNKVREAGLGAEESGRHWRAMCLQAAGDRLTVFGDEGWREDLPKADLRGPVDYYGALPTIYARAGVCLNLTSPLLPAGLTQRHFDVWCAGGVLLTDNTPGLELFPAELTGPVTFSRPGEIPGLFATVAPGRPARERLVAAWREHILAEHTYARRVGVVLDRLNL